MENRKEYISNGITFEQEKYFLDNVINLISLLDRYRDQVIMKEETITQKQGIEIINDVIDMIKDTLLIRVT